MVVAAAEVTSVTGRNLRLFLSGSSFGGLLPAFEPLVRWNIGKTFHSILGDVTSNVRCATTHGQVFHNCRTHQLLCFVLRLLLLLR